MDNETKEMVRRLVAALDSIWGVLNRLARSTDELVESAKTKTVTVVVTPPEDKPKTGEVRP